MKIILEENEKIEFYEGDYFSIYSPEGQEKILEFDYNAFCTGYNQENSIVMTMISPKYYLNDMEEVVLSHKIECGGEEIILTCTLILK